MHSLIGVNYQVNDLGKELPYLMHQSQWNTLGWQFFENMFAFRYLLNNLIAPQEIVEWFDGNIWGLSVH